MSAPDPFDEWDLWGWRDVLMGAVPFVAWLVGASFLFEVWGLLGVGVAFVVAGVGVAWLFSRTDWDAVREKREDGGGSS